LIVHVGQAPYDHVEEQVDDECLVLKELSDRGSDAPLYLYLDLVLLAFLEAVDVLVILLRDHALPHDLLEVSLHIELVVEDY
jgi:hypothetical protein